MKVVVETSMRGFKTAVFQNQPVHDFYNNLEAVLKEVAPQGNLEHLFTKPFADNCKISEAAKVQWMTHLTSKPVDLKSIPYSTQVEVAKRLQQDLDTLRKYASDRSGAEGLPGQYAKFLATIPLSTSLDHIFVINDNIPVMVHWGLFPETAHTSQFYGWDNLRNTVAKLITTPTPPPPLQVLPEPDKDIPQPKPIQTPLSAAPPRKSTRLALLLIALLIAIIALLARSCNQIPPAVIAPISQPATSVVLVGTQSAELNERSIKSRIQVNLNWNLEKLTGEKSSNNSSRNIDLDLGCLVELTNGKSLCIQALNGPENRGAFDTPPYILYFGDDRSGKIIEGENIEINGQHFSSFKRILIFAFIYSGAESWADIDAVVTIDYGEDKLTVPLSSVSSTDRLCAVAMIENVGNTLKVTRLNRFFKNHPTMDKAYSWGLSWGPGKKD